MANASSIDQLKAHLERLRADSVDVVANASRIVVDGVQKLAEQELKALNEYYKSAVKSARELKNKKTSKTYQDLASEQIDLLQDTVQKVVSNARESLNIIADTRAEIARLTQSGQGADNAKALARVSEPARKAVEDVRKAASKAQKTAAETAKNLRKTLESELAEARAKARSAAKDGKKSVQKTRRKVRKQLDTVLDVTPPTIVKKSVKVRPSSTSRAARAAKKPAAKPASSTPAKASKSPAQPKSGGSGKGRDAKKPSARG